eukprot:5544544-Lingulodinium_polyedra.AAC.1
MGQKSTAIAQQSVACGHASQPLMDDCPETPAKRPRVTVQGGGPPPPPPGTGPCSAAAPGEEEQR